MLYSFRSEDLPENREIRCALQSIYGIGSHKASLALSRLGVAYPFFISNYNSYNYSLLLSLLYDFVQSSARLKREVASNIKRLVDSRSYRGHRHTLHLPTRGQRTRTNANTCRKLSKKKTV